MRIHYLAYGSNLHPHRLTQRIASAKLIGVTRLPGLQLTFHKKSRDGSAKCMFAEADLAEDALYGAVFEMQSSDKPTLDAIEGLGLGYDEQHMDLVIDGAWLRTFTYAAAATHVAPDLLPFHWYKELVLLGARYHFMPDDYIAAIAAVPSAPDPDTARCQEKETLLNALRAANLARGATSA